MAKRTAFIVCGSEGLHKRNLINNLKDKYNNSLLISLQEEKEKLEVDLGRKPKAKDLEGLLDEKLEKAFVSAQPVILSDFYYKRSDRKAIVNVLRRYGFNEIGCCIPPEVDTLTNLDRQLLERPPELEEGFSMVR